MTEAQLKEALVAQALELGAAAVGFAPAERWLNREEALPGYRPTDIWPEARTVVTFGIPISPAVLSTAPSIIYRETYVTVNQLLNTISLCLATWLNAQGHPAMNLPYSGQLPEAQAPFRSLFSQVLAAQYAGLGRPGLTHTLVTRRWGPRMRFNSLLLAAQLPPDAMLEEETCTGCQRCAKNCPAQAITPVPGQVIGQLNKAACSAELDRLAQDNALCGLCLRNCPIGEDLRIFKALPSEK